MDIKTILNQVQRQKQQRINEVSQSLLNAAIKHSKKVDVKVPNEIKKLIVKTLNRPLRKFDDEGNMVKDDTLEKWLEKNLSWNCGSDGCEIYDFGYAYVRKVFHTGKFAVFA